MILSATTVHNCWAEVLLHHGSMLITSASLVFLQFIVRLNSEIKCNFEFYIDLKPGFLYDDWVYVDLIGPKNVIFCYLCGIYKNDR